jgi:Siah interacting protein, N terminal
MDDLKLDVEELARLQKLATRSKIKNILAVEIRKAETDLSHVNQMIAKNVEIKTSQVSNENKRYTVELKTYAFDQSPNFVKLYLQLPNVQVSEFGLIIIIAISIYMFLNFLNSRKSPKKT